MPSFPPLIGFGFCPGPERESPGRLTYRYVPPSLADTAASRVAGALNAAAALGVLDPLGPIEAEAFAPSANLTPEGWALWRRLPLYSTIDVHGQEHFEWTAFWEDLPCVTYSAPLATSLFDRALRSTPQHLWAQRHLGRHCRSVHGMGDPDASAMEMDEDQEVLAASRTERVTVPEGLWKVLWAPFDDHLRPLLPTSDEPSMRCVSGTRLQVRAEHLEIEPVDLLRWELPVTVAPAALDMLEEQGVALIDTHTPVSMVPCFDSETPLITMGGPPGAPEATILAPQALDYWTPEKRAELVAYVQTL